MKTVTASAAIDSGRYQPDSKVSGKNGKVISGDAAEQLRQPELRRHHAHRGADKLRQHRLGRGRRQARAQPDAGVHGPLRVHGGPADGLSRPSDERQRPARPQTGKLIPMSSDRVDVGRTAIGQALLLVTPLQMATVAQTIGNGGMRMQPRLVEKVIDPDGRTVDEPLPEEAERVMSRESAAKVGDDDEVGRARGLGHRGGPPGRRAGGQDRHGGDRHRARDQRPVVHRLHRRGRDRRHHRPRAGPGRHRRRPDRQARPAGAGAVRCTRSRATRSSTAATARSAARLGRHGRGLVRRGRGARPARGAEADGRALRRGPGVPRALPARGAGRGRAHAPEHRRDLRPRGVGRHAVHRDGAGRRAHAQGARDRARAAAARDRAIA